MKRKLQVGAGVINYEAGTTIVVTVRTTDAGSLTYDQALTITLTGVNEAPTAVALTASTIVGGSAQGTVVGTLSTTDQDSGDTFTYTITSQAVTGAFQIVGSALQVGSVTSTAASHDVIVRTTDAGGATFDQTLTVTFTNPAAPTDIALSATTVTENLAEGAEVAALSSTDADTAAGFTYTIVSQSVPNAFKITGDKLVAGSAGMDFEATATHTVTVRTTDPDGASYDKTFTIGVTNVVEPGETPTKPDRAARTIMAVVGLVVLVSFVACFYALLTTGGVRQSGSSAGAATASGSTLPNVK